MLKYIALSWADCSAGGAPRITACVTQTGCICFTTVKCPCSSLVDGVCLFISGGENDRSAKAKERADKLSDLKLKVLETQQRHTDSKAFAMKSLHKLTALREEKLECA